jgi:hypothetical protein
MWWVLASGGPLDGVAHSMGDYVTFKSTGISNRIIRFFYYLLYNLYIIISY